MTDITKQICNMNEFGLAESLQISETNSPGKWGTDYCKVFKLDNKYYAFEYNIHDGISWEDAPFDVYRVTPVQYTTTTYQRI